MALINCPECNSEISDKATQCPKCGNPIYPASENQTPQTIELTGKSLKLQQLLVTGLLLAGFIIILANLNSINVIYGILLVIIAIIWGVIVKFVIWWKHG